MYSEAKLIASLRSPITHVPSPLSLSPTLAAPLLSEMSAWRSALRTTYATFGCVLVGWEICRSQGTRVGHMQAQALPVAASLAPKLDEASMGPTARTRWPRSCRKAVLALAP